ERLLGNTVMIRHGSKGDVYVRLVDGSYSAPPGNPSKLIHSGAGAFSRESLHREKMNFNASGKIATYVYPNGIQINFTYSGNDLVQIQNSLGRTLTLTNSGGRVTSISDGTRSIFYTYDANGNLVKFTDAAAKDTNFQYDLPGRLTKFFYPSSPGIAFVTNVYDSLDRVQTQTNANGRTWNLYFAGTRSESVAPDSSSEVWLLNGLGSIVKAI